MKTRIRLLSLSVAACLGTTTLLAQTPPILFQDDFETPEADGSPSIAIWGQSTENPTVPRNTEHQWVRVTDEDSEAYFGEANNNYLHFYSDGDSSTGSNWISTQNNQFDGSTVISVHFDFHRKDSTSSGNNEPKLRFGIGNPIFGNSASRYTVYFQNNAISGQPVVQNNQAHHFQVIYNNTKEPVTYMDGQAVVKADSYDVWIDGERVLTNVKFAYNTASAPVQIEESLTSIGIGIWGSADADFRMDNLVIYDGAYAVGNPPPPDPVIEDQVIFADDFSEFTAQAAPNDMLSQPLFETWKRNPTSVGYPNRIIDVTDENSELYFGEANNHYLRFYHDGQRDDEAPSTNLHLTTNSGFEHPSELITISFDFYEPSGVGGTNAPLEVLPGISTVGNSSRVHKLTLANGSISGIGNLYEEDTINNIQAVFNNSHHPVSYLDGAVTIASDSFDVWLNGRRVLSSYDYGRGGLGVGIPLTSAQFIVWATRNQEMFLDNLQVYNYPHVENPDLTVYPGFADDFSEPTDGKPDPDHWGANVAGNSPPDRILEVTDTDSETYFGEPGNNYMRMFHDGSGTNLTLNAQNRFSSEIITIAFDFFEPAGYGEGNLVLRPGYGSVPNSHRIHEITFNNGSLSGVENVYREGERNRIEIVMNNSAEHHPYLDGSITLASDTYDVWLNGRLVLHNHTYNRGGTYAVGSPLSSLQFAIWNNNTNEFLIDNLEIFEEAYIPDPVEIPYLPDVPGAPPIFADDFTIHDSGWVHWGIWEDLPTGESRPGRSVEVTNEDSETYFGTSENNYLRIAHNGSGSADLVQNAPNAFGEPSPVVTVSFDFFEPAGSGNGSFTLTTGINSLASNEHIHRVTFSNGTVADVENAYEEHVMNNIQIVMNNSNQAEEYHQSSISKTVAPDSFDVWINGELVLADYQYQRGSLALGTALSSLQLAVPAGGATEFLIDNLEVFDYATAQAKPAEPGEGVTFADWAAAHLPEGLRGPEDDAAGDGIPNLVKFALGLDPLTPNRSGLPQIGTITENGENWLTITGQLFTNAADVNVEVQFSTDLVDWHRLDGPLEIIEVISEHTAIIRVTDTEPLDNTSRRFLRLNITQD